MTAKKYILYILPILLLSVVVFSYFYMNKAHRNIAKEQVEFKVSTKELKETFERNDNSQKYVDRVIQLEGVITEVEPLSILIDDSIQVDFLKGEPNAFIMNEPIIIKGRCVGYDDILELVKVDQASIIQVK